MTEILILTFEATAPVFLLALGGYLWIRAGWEFPLGFVTRITMSVAVPLLVFSALVRTELPQAEIGRLALAAAASYIGVIIIVAAGLSLFGMSLRTYLPPITFGNTGNLGLPLALYAFGQVGLEYAIVVFAVMAMLSFTFGVWVVSGGGSLKTTIREPMVFATLLGGLFMWQGWDLPVWLGNSVELAGQMGIPLMLVTLGVALHKLRVRALSGPLVISIAKFLLCGGVTLGAAWLFGVTGLAQAVLVLQLVTPVAVTSFMLATKYDADADPVAEMVVISTLLSLIYLPLTVGYLLKIS